MFNHFRKVLAFAGLATGALALSTSAYAVDLRFTAGEYSKHTLPFFQQVAKDYEAAHPDVHIAVEVLPWDGYLQKLTTDISAGNAPDLSIVATIWVPDFASQNIIEPLDGYMSPEFKSVFIPSFFAPSTIDGKLMGIPAAASARAMMVNLDLFKKAGVEPPKTWDEFYQAAKKISALGDGIYGFGLQGKETETDDYFYYALWSMGGEILKDKKSGLDSPEAMKTANFYKKLIDEKLVEPSPTAYSREDVFQMFKQGKVGMIFTFPMLIPQIKAEAPDLHYAVKPFPTDLKPTTLGVTDVMMLYSGSKAKKEAWDFAQFMYQDKYRSQFDHDEGLLPVTKNIVAQDYYTKNPDLSTFAAGLSYAKFAPTIKDWAEIADITTRSLQAIYTGQGTVEASLKDGAKQIDDILAKH